MIDMWKSARRENDENILDLLETDRKAKILDLGCDDGSKTKLLGEIINSKSLYGIDLNKDALKKAIKIGIIAKRGDLNIKFPFKSNYFDVVHSNQVIEHLISTDNFISEIYRVLKRQGYAVISTQNLSSTINLISLFFGQQAFSQHISEKYQIGTVFSPHHGEKFKSKFWTHKIIFTYFGLKKIFEIYGFSIEKMKTSGYFPLPSAFSKIDPIHSHFITLKVRKK